MSFIKLDEKHQNLANAAYSNEKTALLFVDYLCKTLGSERWFSLGRTHIEQGYMALRKGITEKQKENIENLK